MGRKRRPEKYDVYAADEPVSPIGRRYGTREMVSVFSASAYLNRLLDVEAKVTEVISRHYPTLVPPEAASEIRKKASLDYVTQERVTELEKQTHHDVMSVVQALAEQCDGEAGGYVHYTLTSADVTESAKAIQMKQGLEILICRIEHLRDACLDRAKEWEGVPCIIRTHGLHAVPGVFGLPFAFFAYLLEKGIARLFYDYQNCLEGKISGPIGAFNASKDAGIDAFRIQNEVCSELGIRAAPVASQIPPRENIACIVGDLALLCGTLASLADHIRVLRRTEICELSERGDAAQVGSSTMPHKDVYGGNPIIEERLGSIARVLRGFALTAYESVEIEYARDLRASLSDRTVLPSSFILTDYAGKLLLNIVQRIEAIPENIERNLYQTKGIVTSERVMSRLTVRGLSRQDAHRKISSLATEAFREDKAFGEVLAADPVISGRLSSQEINELSDPRTYTGSAAQIIDHVAGLIGKHRRVRECFKGA
jgi:adenylosuccinate lyase